MSVLEGLLQSFLEIEEQLDAPGLEPDPDRRDWADHREVVAAVKDRFEALLGELRPVLATLEPDDRDIVCQRVAAIGLDIAAVRHASGDGTAALMQVAEMADLAPPGAVRDRAQASGRDPAAFVALARVRSRLNRGEKADAELKRIARQTEEKTLREMARSALHAAKPIRKAPPLWRINGFGTGLYGSRDPIDSTEVKTLCLSALFIPILPLAAYRVIDQGDGTIAFLSRNRLSGFARAARAALLGTVVAAIAWAAVDGYLSSSKRQAKIALAEARELESQGRAGEAAAAYDQLIQRYHSEVSAELIGAAADSMVKLWLAAVPDPLTLSDVPRARQLLERFRALPPRARDGAAAAIVDHIAGADGWVADLGQGSDEAGLEGISFLEAALELSPADRRAATGEALAAARRDLGARLADTRPLAALSQLLAAGDEAALGRAGEVLAAIRERAPALLIPGAASADAWLERVGADRRGASELAADLERIRAWSADGERTAALESRDREALLAARGRSHILDHDLEAALAESLLAEGDLDGARETVLALGAPGWMTPAAEQLAARLAAAAGDLESADRILGAHLRFALPGFQRAARDYNAAAERVQSGLIAVAEGGGGPPELQAVLRGSDEAAARDAFRSWLSGEMDKSEELAALRAALDPYADVVGASLELGMIKLRRAEEARGQARAAILAEAEGVFLAISETAAGLPAYHLGLGKVYHRLGKPAEGDAELQALIGRGDPELTLAVATAYRELGLESRARDIYEQVHREAGPPHNTSAAYSRSILATDLDDRAAWLERSDPSSIEVRIGLDEVAAVRAMQGGDLERGAELFARVAASWEKMSAHDSAAANNAAIAYQQRYAATGDPADLARARAGLETALRLQPQNAIIIANLADACYHESTVEVLGRFLRPQPLRLERAAAEELLDALLLGPERKAVLAALSRHRVYRRAIELTEKRRLLAPRAPDGWENAVTVYGRSGDVAGLERLEQQLQSVEVDVDARRSAREELWAGDEANQLEMLEQRVAADERNLRAAEGTGHARTVAAARHLQAVGVAGHAQFKRDIAGIERAIAALRKAGAEWPALGGDRRAAQLELAAAVLRAAPGEPAVEKMWQAGRNRLGLDIMVAQALRGDDGDAIRAALAADAALPAAAKELAAMALTRPTLTEQVLLELTGAEARPDGYFTRDDIRLAVEVAAAVDPSPDAVARLALWKSSP